jgi:hypothetical protein
VLKLDNQLLANYRAWLVANGMVLPNPLVWNAEFTRDALEIFQENVLANNGTLPLNPPLEVHPYWLDFPLQNFNKYMVGTFPPINYFCDQIPIIELNHPNGQYYDCAPDIPFYHGSRQSMWSHLLTNLENDELLAILNNAVQPAPINRTMSKQYLIAFLNACEINYADVVFKAQRNLAGGKYTSDDAKLFNIEINSGLIEHLLQNDQAEFILFNSGSTFRNSGLSIHQNVNPNGAPGTVNVDCGCALDYFIRGCQELGHLVELRIENGPTPHFPWTAIDADNVELLTGQMRNKIIFEMRISSGNLIREVTVITGPSPSRQSNRGLPANGNYINWLHNINPQGSPPIFKNEIYASFRGNNWDDLYTLNVD